MRHLAFALAVLCTAPLCAQSAHPPFPDPAKVLKDDKQFNAVRFDGGDTFSVHQAPADFELEAFDFSSDEKQLFLEWKSGRLETRDLDSGKKIAESKPVSGPLWEVADDEGKKQLIVVTEHGVIRFIDPRSGKKKREIQAEKGRFNYDIQKVLLAPDGSWVAYVNQDNGKVLDLRGDSPKVLADLGDGYDMALSPDRSTLWVMNRTKLFGLNVNDWNSVGTAALLDQVKPDKTPNLAVVSNGGAAVAFIPSQGGLLEYDLPSLKSRKVTDIPTYWVGADPEHNQVFVHEFKVSALYAADGTVRCRWDIHPAQDFKMSPSGRWLGDRMFGKVELWSTQALIDACPAKP
jgi:WD40 repeat protein